MSWGLVYLTVIYSLSVLCLFITDELSSVCNERSQCGDSFVCKQAPTIGSRQYAAVVQVEWRIHTLIKTHIIWFRLRLWFQLWHTKKAFDFISTHLYILLIVMLDINMVTKCEIIGRNGFGNIWYTRKLAYLPVATTRDERLQGLTGDLKAYLFHIKKELQDSGECKEEVFRYIIHLWCVLKSYSGHRWNQNLSPSNISLNERMGCDGFRLDVELKWMKCRRCECSNHNIHGDADQPQHKSAWNQNEIENQHKPTTPQLQSWCDDGLKRCEWRWLDERPHNNCHWFVRVKHYQHSTPKLYGKYMVYIIVVAHCTGLTLHM